MHFGLRGKTADIRMPFRVLSYNGMLFCEIRKSSKTRKNVDEKCDTIQIPGPNSCELKEQ